MLGGGGDTKILPRCPPQLSAPALSWAKQEPAPGLPGAGGGEGCGLPGPLLVDVGVSERQREPMIYYTAVPASGAFLLGSCHCRAAGTHTPAHTRSIHPSLPSQPGLRPLSPPRARKCLQTTCRPRGGGGGNRARRWRRGWWGGRRRPEPGVRRGRGGPVFPLKSSRLSPPAEHPLLAHLARPAAGSAAQPPRARGMQQQQPEPPTHTTTPTTPGTGWPRAPAFAFLM